MVILFLSKSICMSFTVLYSTPHRSISGLDCTLRSCSLTSIYLSIKPISFHPSPCMSSSLSSKTSLPCHLFPLPSFSFLLPPLPNPPIYLICCNAFLSIHRFTAPMYRRFVLVSLAFLHQQSAATNSISA